MQKKIKKEASEISRLIKFLFVSSFFLPLSCYMAKGPYESVEILTSSNWVLSEIKDQAVTLHDFKKGKPYLHFSTEGQLTIFTGCDYLQGTFVARGSLIRMKFDTSNLCRTYLASDFVNALKLSNTFKTRLEKLVLIRDTSELMYFFPK
ncbi:MAG TPA: META domain-containing protein [Chitinophagaceae bacterium]|nr:META domain-containing protein [Chitinophagaceae bacterium]